MVHLQNWILFSYWNKDINLAGKWMKPENTTLSKIYQKVGRPWLKLMFSSIWLIGICSVFSVLVELQSATTRNTRHPMCSTSSSATSGRKWWTYEASTNDIKKWLINWFSLGKHIEKGSQSIYPLCDTFIRKVKKKNAEAMQVWIRKPHGAPW